MRRVAAGVVILLCATLSGAGAVDGDIQIGEGWRVLEVMSDERAGVDITIVYRGPSAAWTIHERDGAPGPGGFVWLSSAETTASVQVASLQIDQPVLNAPSTTAGTRAGEPGIHRVFLLLAGGIEQATFRADPGTSYRVLATGEVQSYSGSDLAELASVRASAGNAAIFATLDARLDFTVENTLLGWFGRPPFPFGAYPGVATLTSASGTTACDTSGAWLVAERLGMEQCVFKNFAGPNARGPGDYTFEWTAVGATAYNVPVIAWADVDWPT